MVIKLERDQAKPVLFGTFAGHQTGSAKPAHPFVAEPAEPTARPLPQPTAPAAMSLADAIAALERQIGTDPEGAALTPLLIYLADMVDLKAARPALKTLLARSIEIDAETTIAVAVVPVLRQNADHLAKQLLPTTRTALARVTYIHRAPGLLTREAGRLRKDRLAAASRP